MSRKDQTVNILLSRKKDEDEDENDDEDDEEDDVQVYTFCVNLCATFTQSVWQVFKLRHIA